MKDRLPLFFVSVYLAQGLVGAAYEPISYLLKDGLGLGPAEAAGFVAWMTLPFLLKPLLGIVADGLPVAGRRRVPWMVLAAAATSLGWLALSLLPRYSYTPTLFLLTAVNVGIVFSDVLCDGVMVEKGKESGLTGVYQAVQLATLYACALGAGVGGGWLAQHASYRAIFALTAVFPLLMAVGTRFVPEAPEPPGAAGRAGRGMAGLLAGRRFWVVSAVIFLVSFTPYQGTAFFYYQSEALSFSKGMIGALTSVDGVAGLLGAAMFGGWCRRFDPLTLARTGIAVTIPMSLLFLLYRGPASAFALTTLSGLLGVAARLALMDLAARASARHAEATAFALFMSVFNLAAWASNSSGAAAYGHLAPAGPQRAMAVLILASALCSALAFPLLGFLSSDEVSA
ncbi:MAG: hypothetical protein HY928_18415 [Elusimicrobia bacterium]|nr:hypothetical protein [Elusimicrobiota bacterium]